MHLDIEGKNTAIVPHLLGRIAERIEQLNASHTDICEARITLVHQGCQYEARVRLLLADRTLAVVQHGNSPDAAIGMAIRCVENILQARRAQRERVQAASRSPQKGRYAPAAPKLRKYADRAL